MLVRTWRKGDPLPLSVEMQTGAATLENSMEVPQKTKNRTTLRPSNCTTRHLSRGYRCAVAKGHMHPHVYSSTINNSQSMERAQMSIDRWMDKEDVVYVYTHTHTHTHICILFCYTKRVLNTLPEYWLTGCICDDLNLYVPFGAPGWLSRLSVRLRLRSRSRGPWVRAPRRALGRWFGAWSLLPILCLPLSLSAPPPFMLCLSRSLSQK